MRIDVITIFPEAYTSILNESILRRAQANGIAQVNVVDLRDYTTDKHQTLDERPYGGGAGMVMKPEPLFKAVEDVSTSNETHIVLVTPQGKTYTQRTAERFAEHKHLVLICGHYEGVDERVRQNLVNEEVSVGDFVMTNGNLAAMMIVDSVVRLLPGSLGSPESKETESFDSEALLDYPQYTRPQEYRGIRVPDILLSGDHKRIREWRYGLRRIRTRFRRPDLINEQQDKSNEA